MVISGVVEGRYGQVALVPLPFSKIFGSRKTCLKMQNFGLKQFWGNLGVKLTICAPIN